MTTYKPTRLMKAVKLVAALISVFSSSQVQAQTPATAPSVSAQYDTTTLTFPAKQSTALTVHNESVGASVQGVLQQQMFYVFGIPLEEGLNALRVERNPPTTSQELISVARIANARNAVVVRPEPAYLETVPGKVTLNITTQLVSSDQPEALLIDRDGDYIIDETVPYTDSYTIRYESVGRFLPIVTVRMSTGKLVTSKPFSTPLVATVAPTTMKADKALLVPGPVADVEYDSNLRRAYALRTSPPQVFLIDIERATVRMIPIQGASNPQGIGIDADGNIYVADTGNDRVIKLLAGRGYAPDVSISPDGSFGGTGSEPGHFLAPRDVAITIRAGAVVIVADTGNNRLQRMTASGGFGSIIDGSETADGQLNGPKRLMFSVGGSIQVIDEERLRVFDPLSGREKKGFTHHGMLQSLTSSPWDETYVALDATSGTVRFLDAQSWASLRTITTLPKKSLIAAFVDYPDSGPQLITLSEGGGALLRGELLLDPQGLSPADIAEHFINALAVADILGASAFIAPSSQGQLDLLFADADARARVAALARQTHKLRVVTRTTRASMVEADIGTSALASFKMGRVLSQRGEWAVERFPWADGN